MEVKQKPNDIVIIRAEHTGAESGSSSSSNTKHDGRKKQQQKNKQVNGSAQRSMRP